MAKNPDGLPFDYIQAKHDYGKSPVAKEGIVLHMAEGSRVVEYLAGGNVLRGVSATFGIRTDGEVVQMLPLDHVSGSLNPRDVRTSDDPRGRWGRRFTEYYGPELMSGRANQLTISIECAGFAAAGPTTVQQAAIIDLVKTLRKRFGNSLGFNIHCDFADYKGCPGWSQGIQGIIGAVGHGREGDPVHGPGPEDVVASRLRARLEATKTRLDEAEDLIASTGARLTAYIPANEPA